MRNCLKFGLFGVNLAYAESFLLNSAVKFGLKVKIRLQAENCNHYIYIMRTHSWITLLIFVIFCVNRLQSEPSSTSCANEFGSRHNFHFKLNKESKLRNELSSELVSNKLLRKFLSNDITKYFLLKSYHLLFD
jgi:hypothetical protein